MKAATLLSSGALALAGAALVVALRGTVAEDADAGAGADVRVAEPKAADAAAAEALARELAALRERIVALEMQASGEPAAPLRLPSDLVTQAELEALREELGGAAGPASAAGEDAFEQQVAVVLTELRKEEQLARAVERLEQERAALDRRVTTWGDWLELDEAQREGLRSLLEQRDASEREILQAWAEGVEGAVLDRRRAISERQFYEGLRARLGPDQAARLDTKFGGEGK